METERGVPDSAKKVEEEGNVPKSLITPE